MTLKDFGFQIAGVTPKNTVFNFFEAETLELNQLGVPGSVLAPKADGLFSDANVQSNLVAKSLSGNGHVRLPLLSGCLPIGNQINLSAGVG